MVRRTKLMLAAGSPPNTASAIASEPALRWDAVESGRVLDQNLAPLAFG